MQPAAEGRFARLRRIIVLAAALLAAFTAVLQFGAQAPDLVVATQEAETDCVVVRAVARNESTMLVPARGGSDVSRCDDNTLAVPSDFVSEEFDVSRNGDFLVLPVTILGHRYSFALDTGCVFCAVD